MRVIEPAHIYELPNKENPLITQKLSFIHKARNQQDKVELVHDGTTTEEVLKVLIHRLTDLNKQVPDYHNEISLSLLGSVLEHQKARTAERKEQGIEGTFKESINHQQFKMKGT